MGDKPLAAITPPVVQALKARYRATPWWANAHLRTLRLLFSFARREGWWTGDNPVAAPRQLRTAPRARTWTDRQVARFLDGDPVHGLAPAPWPLRLAMRLALRTGQRQTDLLAAPMAQLAAGTLHVRQSKTGQPVWIPLGDALLAEIAARPEGAADTILVTAAGRPWRADHFRHAWRARTLACGLDGLQFRDLRRTAASSTGDLAHASALLGHGSTGITARVYRVRDKVKPVR